MDREWSQKDAGVGAPAAVRREGVVWRVTSAVLAGALAVTAAAVPGTALSQRGGPAVEVVVRGVEGAGTEAAALAVERAGGEVTRELGLIDGVAATVPAGELDDLGVARSVRGVTPDGTVQLLDNDDDDDGQFDDFAQGYTSPADDFGSMYNVTKAIGAHDVWSDGFRGRGIGIALIDSGVAPVTGLTTSGKVRNGADLSFDSQADNLAYTDAYGHGTHMAGIMAGRDPNIPAGSENDYKYFVGVAPDAHVINVKVGAYNGAVDVSQVIAAVDWVVEHRNDPGMNIRVLNLSFGTDGVQDTRLDPLSYAVETAWKKGIVVVVSGGNDGTERGSLDNPARNPFVIAVGAGDMRGTYGVADDVVPAFSSRGSSSRRVDLVAPGKSIVSLRTPGSTVDNDNPGGRVRTRFFRGSGTSQAAAVVSGAAALLLSQRPAMTPDQLKRLLVMSAQPMPLADAAGRGAGMIDVKRAHELVPLAYSQTFTRGTGTGSLEQARGAAYVTQNGVNLIGERDIFGTTWNGSTWASAANAETAWNGGRWLTHDMTGTCWCGSSFAGSSSTWSRSSWRETSWTRSSWRDAYWSRSSWRSGSWINGGW
jgi:serine protease AprX